MTHPADDRTRAYLLQLMRETPDELVWFVRALSHLVRELDYDIGRLAGTATKMKAIKDMWPDQMEREDLLRWMRESPVELLRVVRNMARHVCEMQERVGGLADLATRSQAVGELWPLVESERKRGDAV